jgi:hypothetical protein
LGGALSGDQASRVPFGSWPYAFGGSFRRRYMQHWRMAVRDRVGAHRERMRKRGFRLVQIWVPDVRSEGFAAEAHQQSAAVGAADRLGDDQDFIEAISVGWDE